MSRSVIWEFKRSIQGSEPYYSDKYERASERLGKYMESMAVNLTEWFDAGTNTGYLKVEFAACTESERQRIIAPITESWSPSMAVIPSRAVKVQKYMVDAGVVEEAPKTTKFDDILAARVSQIQGASHNTIATAKTTATGGAVTTNPGTAQSSSPWFNYMQGKGASSPLQIYRDSPVLTADMIRSITEKMRQSGISNPYIYIKRGN